MSWNDEMITQEFKDEWPVGTKVVVPEDSEAVDMLGVDAGLELIVSGWKYSDVPRLQFYSPDGDSNPDGKGNYRWILKPEWVEKVIETPKRIPVDFDTVEPGTKVYLVENTSRGYNALKGSEAIVFKSEFWMGKPHLNVNWVKGTNFSQHDGIYPVVDFEMDSVEPKVEPKAEPKSGEFAVGDKVVCIDPRKKLIDGNEYEVINTFSTGDEVTHVQVNDGGGWYFTDRFRHAEVLTPPDALRKVVEDTIAFAFKNHSVDHLRGNLADDLIENLNRYINLK